MASCTPYTIPGTSRHLFEDKQRLFDDSQQVAFPIVAGVPVIFPTSQKPTFDAYSVSRSSEIDPNDEWQIESLAIDPPLKLRVKELLLHGRDCAIDPAINYLLLATNGLAYESSLGRLDQYPIPTLPLPPANGATFLDIGCSWGRWCASAALKGYRVQGIDPSLGAVLAARRMFSQLGLGGEFVCGDGRSLPFPDNSFDVVYSYSVLQHFSDEDVGATWAEIGRVLKPGGTALVQMANGLGVRSIYHLTRRRFRRPRVFEVRYRRPAQLRRLGEKYVGATTLEVDCYFGLGLQESDVHLYRTPARMALQASQYLKRLSSIIAPMTFFADSIFVRSKKVVKQNGSE